MIFYDFRRNPFRLPGILTETIQFVKRIPNEISPGFWKDGLSLRYSNQNVSRMPNETSSRFLEEYLQFSKQNLYSVQDESSHVLTKNLSKFSNEIFPLFEHLQMDSPQDFWRNLSSIPDEFSPGFLKEYIYRYYRRSLSDSTGKISPRFQKKSLHDFRRNLSTILHGIPPGYRRNLSRITDSISPVLKWKFFSIRD